MDSKIKEESNNLNSPAITFVVGVFNEEERIEGVLSHAIRWADEVLVVDKSSTDRTVEICRAFDPKVRVITVPFSPQGCDQPDVWYQQAGNDWIFVGTCSEVPTRRLISEVRRLLARDQDRLDLVMVPRRMYSLGIHHPSSPWNVPYYPFLIHRHRAIIANVIHDHFRAPDPTRVATIPYSEDCCVHHLTHPTARRFIDIHADYAEIEAGVDRDPDQAILSWLKNIHDAFPGIMRTGKDWLGIFSAWTIYNLSNVLFTWERSRGADIPAFYNQLRAQLLAEEWGVSLTDCQDSDSIQSESDCDVNISTKMEGVSDLKKTVFVAFCAANIIFYLRYPRAIPHSLRCWAAAKKARLLRKIRSLR